MKKILYFMIIASLILLLLIPLKGLVNDDIPKGSIGIIYGNKVEIDGNPSNRLKARLDTGLYLLNEGVLDKIIVSGGIGKEGFDEADIMKDYLLDVGIDLNKIIVDSEGYTTQKTSNNAMNLIDINTNVVGISQFYHISRVKLSLENIGFNKVYGYSPCYFEFRDIYSSLREIPAYFKYLLFY